MSLIESPGLNTINTPLKSISLPSEEYVLSLALLPNAYAASASAPSNSIYLFDKTNLRTIQALSGHDEPITSLRTVHTLAGLNRPLLASSGRDGYVKIWDDRSASVSLKMSTSGRPRSLLSFDVSTDGLTVAAGTDLQGDDASILYFDPRNPSAPIRTHSSTHSDDITSLHFLQFPRSKILLSASSDGLISTSNADEEDEDEAVLHVANWGTSISQTGWISVSAGARAWAASDMETFSCWTDELDLLADQDIRKPSVHNVDRTWVTDYLIGCQNSSLEFGSQGLSVFVGSNEGDVALITSSNLSDSAAPWTLHRLWTTGHIGVVRSILWDEANSVIVTGGEDSKLSIWSSPPLGSAPSTPTQIDEGQNQDDDSMDVDMDMGDSEETPRRKRGWEHEGDDGGKRARRL